MNYTNEALKYIQDEIICAKTPDEKFRELKLALRNFTDLREDWILHILTETKLEDFKGPIKPKSAFSNQRKCDIMCFLIGEYVLSRFPNIPKKNFLYFEIYFRNMIEYTFDGFSEFYDIGYQAARHLYAHSIETHLEQGSDWEIFAEELQFCAQMLVDGDFLFSINESAYGKEGERTIYWDRMNHAGHINPYGNFNVPVDQALHSIYIERDLNAFYTDFPSYLLEFDDYR